MKSRILFLSLTFLVLCLIQVSAGTIPALSNYWPLNKTFLTDTYAKEVNLTFVTDQGGLDNASGYYPSGLIGNQRLFNANYEAYLTGVVDMKANLTVCMWRNQTLGNVFHYDMTYGGGATNSNFFALWARANGTTQAVKVKSTTAYVIAGSTVALTLNKWYFICFSKNLTQIALYINGLVNTTANDDAEPDGTNTEAISIGDPNADGNGMVIDELQFWNITLTAAQISMVYYNETNGTFPPFAGAPTNTGPTWNYLQNNVTNGTVKVTDVVKFNVSLSDDSGLSYVILGSNDSGVWANRTKILIDGLQINLADNFSIISTVNMTFCGQFYFNDTNNIWNSTDQYCVRMGNYPPYITIPLNFTNATRSNSFTTWARSRDPDGIANLRNVSITSTSGTCVFMYNYTSGNSTTSYFNCSGTAGNLATVQMNFTDQAGINATTIAASNTYPSIISTCSYSGSGNWEVDCTESCNLTGLYDLAGNNVILSGSGTVNLYVSSRNSTVCYQEFANGSVDCGGLSTGVYGNGTRILYVNYTKPNNAVNNSIWMVKSGIFTTVANNYTIPTECWNASPNKLILAVYVSEANGTTGQSSLVSIQAKFCYNGSAVNSFTFPNGGTLPYGFQLMNFSYGDFQNDASAFPLGPQTWWDGDWSTSTFFSTAYVSGEPNWDTSQLVGANMIGLAFEEAMFWNITFPDLSCYQESCNASTSCGGLSTGVYGTDGTWGSVVSNVWDEDWITFANATTSYNGSVFINYSKPRGYYNSSTWQVKDGVGNATLNINSSCWSFSPSVLFLRAFSDGNLNSSLWSCYNSTDWISLRDTGKATSSSLYEEGMNWKLSSGKIYNWTRFKVDTGCHLIIDRGGKIGRT